MGSHRVGHDWSDLAAADHTQPQRNAVEKWKEKLKNQVFEDTGLKQLKGNLGSKNSQELSLLAGRVGSNISDLFVLLLKRWILRRWFDEPSLNLMSTAWSGELEVLHWYHQGNWVGEVSKTKTQLFQPENSEVDVGKSNQQRFTTQPKCGG